LGKLDGTRH
jgi:hypothetical protein